MIKNLHILMFCALATLAHAAAHAPAPLNFDPNLNSSESGTIDAIQDLRWYCDAGKVKLPYRDFWKSLESKSDAREDFIHQSGSDESRKNLALQTVEKSYLSEVYVHLDDLSRQFMGTPQESFPAILQLNSCLSGVLSSTKFTSLCGYYAEGVVQKSIGKTLSPARNCLVAQGFAQSRDREKAQIYSAKCEDAETLALIRHFLTTPEALSKEAALLALGLSSSPADQAQYSRLVAELAQDPKEESLKSYLRFLESHSGMPVNACDALDLYALLSKTTLASRLVANPDFAEGIQRFLKSSNDHLATLIKKGDAADLVPLFVELPGRKLSGEHFALRKTLPSSVLKQIEALEVATRDLSAPSKDFKFKSLPLSPTPTAERELFVNLEDSTVLLDALTSDSWRCTKDGQIQMARDAGNEFLSKNIDLKSKYENQARVLESIELTALSKLLSLWQSRTLTETATLSELVGLRQRSQSPKFIARVNQIIPSILAQSELIDLWSFSQLTGTEPRSESAHWAFNVALIRMIDSNIPEERDLYRRLISALSPEQREQFISSLKTNFNDPALNLCITLEGGDAFKATKTAFFSRRFDHPDFRAISAIAAGDRSDLILESSDSIIEAFLDYPDPTFQIKANLALLYRMKGNPRVLSEIIKRIEKRDQNLLYHLGPIVQKTSPPVDLEPLVPALISISDFSDSRDVALFVISRKGGAESRATMEKAARDEISTYRMRGLNWIVNSPFSTRESKLALTHELIEKHGGLRQTELFITLVRNQRKLETDPDEEILSLLTRKGHIQTAVQIQLALTNQSDEIKRAFRKELRERFLAGEKTGPIVQLLSQGFDRELIPLMEEIVRDSKVAKEREVAMHWLVKEPRYPKDLKLRLLQNAQFHQE